MRPLHRLGDLGARQTRIDELVEGHRHVGAEQCLDLHRALGREAVRRAVEVRGEGDPVVVDAPQVRQREDLEAARVGQDRSVPAHEPMQATEPGDALGGRTQVQVVRVAEDHLRPRRAQIAGRQRLDRGLGADRHELRRIDRSMGGRQPAEARVPDAGRLEG